MYRDPTHGATAFLATRARIDSPAHRWYALTPYSRPSEDAVADEQDKTPASDELIMCYISKQMVPMSDTVEVKYGPNKKYRVLPKYVKY